MGFGSGPAPRRQSPLASIAAGAAQYVYIEMPDGRLTKAMIMNLEVSYDQGRTGFFPEDFRAGEQRAPNQPMRVKLEAIVLEYEDVSNVKAAIDRDAQQLLAREQQTKKKGRAPAIPPKPKVEPKSATVRRFEDLEPVEPDEPEKK
jgi:hypothetical protein